MGRRGLGSGSGRGGLRDLPWIRQPCVEFADRRPQDPGEQPRPVDVGVDVVTPADAGEGAEDSRGCSAAGGQHGATDCHSTDGTQPTRKTGTCDAPVGTLTQENAGRIRPAPGPTRRIEPLPESTQAAIRQAFTKCHRDILALCLTLLCAQPTEDRSELSTLISAWVRIPGTLRQRILGLIEGATISETGVTDELANPRDSRTVSETLRPGSGG